MAPTLAAVLGLSRPHPEVRSGTALPVVESEAAPPRLVVEIVWKGAPEAVAETLAEFNRAGEGTGTTELGPGSEPTDPAAFLTTIGTGGVPSQHGITGTLVRDPSGTVARPWSKTIPLSVIAGLGDDLDESNDGRSRVGAILGSRSERGIVGGTWYLGHDRDDVLLVSGLRAQMESFRGLLDQGYGDDDIPDLLAMVLEGEGAALSRSLARIERAAEDATQGEVTFVLIGTPAAEMSGGDSLASMVQRTIDDLAPSGRRLVQAVVPGGVFLDQEELAAEQLEDDIVIDELRALEDPSGEPLFRDVFPQIAISLASYC
ncbi:MAG: hypothetical protein H0U16_01310 [Actinobacteria bacterium]|nr:hypothetical protein [Actinomycetota bacterium]